MSYTETVQIFSHLIVKMCMREYIMKIVYHSPQGQFLFCNKRPPEGAKKRGCPLFFEAETDSSDLV